MVLFLVLNGDGERNGVTQDKLYIVWCNVSGASVKFHVMHMFIGVVTAVGVSYSLVDKIILILKEIVQDSDPILKSNISGYNKVFLVFSFFKTNRTLKPKIRT